MTSAQHGHSHSARAYSHAERHPPFAHDIPARVLPVAQIGTFRLFRLLSLYPRVEIELRVFPYRDSAVLHDGPSHPVDVAVAENGGTDGVCPPYDAISYTWNPNPSLDPGHPIPTQQVAIHTRQSTQPSTITVTSHLIYGLLTAQELCAPTWLFVDAICIDQNDNWDKAIQVQGMNRIFRDAERVFVWLGMDLKPPTLESDGAVIVDDKNQQDLSSVAGTYTGACLLRIPALVLALESYLEHHETSRSGRQNRKGVDQNQTSILSDVPLDIPMASDPIWQDLERLRLNPYFSRLWVIQEVTLARDPVLLCGRHSLSWSTYAQLTSLCETIITGLFSKQHDAKLVNQLYFAYNSRVSAMTQLQNRVGSLSNNGLLFGGSAAENVHFLTLLIHNIRKSKASVSLDRVYSIIGLLNDQFRGRIRIDYSSDCLREYWIKWVEFFQIMLSLVPEIVQEVFSNATYLERHPDLPSWCPNLADDSEKRGIFGPAVKLAGMPHGEPWRSPLDASWVSTIPGTFCLRLWGLSVDEVAHVVDLSWIEERLQWGRICVDQNVDIDSDVAQSILITLWKCLDLLREHNPSSDDGDPILARCLIAGSYDEHTVEPAQLIKDYIAFASYLEHYTWGPMSSGHFKKATRSSALRFGERFQRVARKRAVFVTKSGHIGLCSCKANKGDVLCIVMNFRLPYLVRNNGKDGAYHLIGETYVESLMRGEAFRGRDLTKEPLEQFIIC